MSQKHTEESAAADPPEKVSPPPMPTPGTEQEEAELPRRRRPEKGKEPIWWWPIEFFSSFGLATVVLFFLFIIVWLGTLEQIEQGLYDTQKEYFESWYLVHWTGHGKIPILLPGGMLLMGLLFTNIVCGGIIRLRKKPQTAGVLTAHLSIAFLLLAGWVSYKFKKEGNMALYPGESSNVVMSYHDWVLEIAELESDKDVWVIPDADFNDLEGSKARVFHNPALPFEVKLYGYVRNATIQSQSGNQGSFGQPVVGGLFLAAQPLTTENEQNVGGVLCEITSGGERLGESLLSPHARHPFSFEKDGRKFAISMTRERWEVPYTVQVDKFIHEVYPKTNKPKVFRSEIQRIEDDRQEQVKISMNKPMRHGGYTFFQASWGPPDAGPDDKKYTVFAVVRNPSDSWPLWACIAAAIGLMAHFIFQLVKSYQRTSRTARKAQTN